MSSHSGLALVGALLNRTKIKQRLDGFQLPGCREPSISHCDIVFSMVGLLCLAKPDFEAIEPFREQPFFKQSLGIEKCPSSPTLRQRLKTIENNFDQMLKQESADLVRKTAPAITPVSTSNGPLVPLDIDVSPFDNSKTKKEGVSRTYKGFDGYAPIFAYLGREGYLVDLELREGKQHCQKETPDFLRSSIKYAKQITDDRLLVRLDSGNDSLENIRICIDEDVDFIIKRNLRKERLEDWLKTAQEAGHLEYSDDRKTVWRGTTYRKVEGFASPLRIEFEVVERRVVKGEVLLFPQIDVETFWTILSVGPGEVIELYHDHGTSEQYHSELKTDMDLERLPSESFELNALVLLLGMLAYNILRLCGQESLREDNGTLGKRPSYRRKSSRRRLRTVIQDLIYLAGRVVSHSRKLYISFGMYSPWAEVWNDLYLSFMAADT